MRAGRPVPSPYGTAKMGPDRPPAPIKTHPLFTSGSVSLRRAFPASPRRLRRRGKNISKLGENKEEEILGALPESKPHQGGCHFPQPHWLKHTPEIPAVTFAASTLPRTPFVFLVSVRCLICDSTNVSASLITSRLNFPN